MENKNTLTFCVLEGSFIAVMLFEITAIINMVIGVIFTFLGVSKQEKARLRKGAIYMLVAGL